MSWTGTVSGQKLDYLNPDPDTIDLQDIAYGLSNACRFSGQLERHYSVAQHSVSVAKTVWDETRDPVIAMQGLLHDASEAYTGDCATPLKDLLGHTWRAIENNLQRAIYAKFNVSNVKHHHVKEADRRWMVTEKRQLQPRGPSWEGTRFGDIVPYAQTIEPLVPAFAREAFLSMFFMLKQEINKVETVDLTCRGLD